MNNLSKKSGFRQIKLENDENTNCGSQPQWQERMMQTAVEKRFNRAEIS